MAISSKRKGLRDERSAKLYGDKPIVVPRERFDEILQDVANEYDESLNWFKQNYERDFIEYRANYFSIPGEIFKPWSDSNDYFMPSTNITVENYLVREMATVRGGRNFLTVFPRGRADEQKAKIAELVLRYQFQTPMDGFRKLADFKRWRFVYGTSIATIPWNLQIERQFIPGKYIWDNNRQDWIRESPGESQEAVSEEELLAQGGTGPIDGPTPPKDFSGIDVTSIIDSDDNLVLKDLFQEVRVKDHPEMIVQDIFNVRLDPNGGPDIQEHRYTIIESIETIDEIRKKAAQGIYDQSQVDILETMIEKDSDGVMDKSDSRDYLDAVEGKRNDVPVKGGVKIWTRYGKYAIDEDNFEQETIGVFAMEGKVILRFGQTHYVSNGIPYRPIVMDHFIRDPLRPYGVGIGQILRPLNYLLNHLVNQILNHGDMHNSPILIYPSEGQWSPQDYTWGPGQSWPSDNSDGFRFLESPDIKSSQVQMITFIEGFIQKTLGINDFTMGSGSGSIVNNQTAHGLANIMRETNRRIDYYAQSSNEGAIKDIYTIMLKEDQQFMDEMEIPKITDIDAREFGFTTVFNKDIQGLYDLEIFADSLTASKEFDQIKSQNFVQVLSQLIDPQTGLPLYEIRKIGDKFIESYGEPFPETFHNPQVDAAKKQLEQDPELSGLAGGGGAEQGKPGNPATIGQRLEPEGSLGTIKGS